MKVGSYYLDIVSGDVYICEDVQLYWTFVRNTETGELVMLTEAEIRNMNEY